MEQAQIPRGANHHHHYDEGDTADGMLGGIGSDTEGRGEQIIIIIIIMTIIINLVIVFLFIIIIIFEPRNVWKDTKLILYKVQSYINVCWRLLKHEIHPHAMFLSMLFLIPYCFFLFISECTQ